MKNIMVAGGDRRMLLLAERLRKDGYEVHTLGLTAGDEEKRMIAPDLLLMPYPFSVKNGKVPTLTGLTLQPQDVLQLAGERTILLTGAGLEEVETQFSGCMLRYTDADDFLAHNAELSAEAAVFETMLHSDLALADSRILVMGYGAFGRMLAMKLKALEAEVWVAVRREQQRAQAESEGMNAILLAQLGQIIPDMKMILNTIPAWVLDETLLEKVPEGCWLLETASAPYGFDRQAAGKMGKQCALLPGLPARYAPASAALVLYRAVQQLTGRCS